MPRVRGADLEKALAVTVLRPEAQITGLAAHTARKAKTAPTATLWTRTVEPDAPPRIQPAWLRDVERKESLRRERLRLWRAAGAKAPPKVKPKPWMKPLPRGLADRLQADPQFQGDAKPPVKHNDFTHSDPRWRRLPDVTLVSPAPSGPYKF